MDITVCIPTHPARIKNGMTKRAVGSVFGQSHPASALIVENDTEKRGAPFTRHAALMKVTTPWVAFLDSDDQFLTNHLAVLAKGALEADSDYVFSWFQPVGFGADPLGHFGKTWDPDNPTQTTITTLVRTELAQSVGFYTPPEGAEIDGERYGEDFQFTIGCRDAGAKIVHIPARTWIWNYHGMNTSGLPTNGDAKWNVTNGSQ